MAEAPVILSFRADGPYWTDLVHLLAYPKGVSYVWPFRYSSKRIQPDLLREVDNLESRKKLRNASALIAARFQTASATDRILISRYATIVHADVFAGTYSFYFRLDGAPRFADALDLHSVATTTAQHVEHLAFREQLGSPLATIESADLVGVSWRQFARLLSVEKLLPIADEAKRSLFMHIGAPSREGKELEARSLWKATKWPWQAAGEEVYGFRLKENREYVVRYSHYVPALEQVNTTVREIIVQPRSATKEIEFSTSDATLIGNYGTQQVLASALAPNAAWREFSLAPKDATLSSQTQNITIITHKMTVPWKVAWSFTRWVWRSLLPTILLFIALVMVGGAGLIDRNLAKILDGTLTWSQVVERWPLIVLLLIGSALGSIAVPLLQLRTRAK